MEKQHETVYGNTFSLYSQEDIEEFIEPLHIRFERNGLDPRQIFHGKSCFDAGCGNGRGMLFMLENGAAHVHGYDFSKKNIKTTKRVIESFGYSNYSLEQGTLEAIPMQDESVDFVWCNGVIMHTAKPDACLTEIARILKVGGQSWIYVYGAGGIYWRIITFFREFLKDIPADTCIEALSLMRYETRYIAEFIDDWYVPFLRMYTHADFGARLVALGFEDQPPLRFGVDYDTSHRKNTSTDPQEPLLTGEGDLRYLVTKIRPEQNSVNLPDNPLGSEYPWPELFVREVEPALEELATGVTDPWLRIAAAAHIQREVRLALTNADTLKLDVFTGPLHRIAVMTRNLQQTLLNR